jgi:hypothetical protein
MSYDGDEPPIRPPRRAQTLPVRFATETGPYPPSVNATEDYIRNPFPARREPYFPTGNDPEIYLQARHSREPDWAFASPESQARFPPPVDRYRDHISHRTVRRYRSRVDSDNDSDEVVVIEEDSPERRSRPIIINNRSQDRSRERPQGRGNDHFDAELRE